MKIQIYDATLREGAQGAGAAFTVESKLRIADMLDRLGVDYIEAGNPGSNPKDAAFYARMRSAPLAHAKLVAFGATCRVGLAPADDPNIQALTSANTPAVAIFGKCWDFHVTDVLGATLSQNLDIIRATIAYFKELGKEVIFDAEHFFDGCKRNPEYAMQALRAAREADWLCLCDTNGGCFPFEIEAMTRAVVAEFGESVGIHCHNDTGMAAANTVQAVRAGARMAQVTSNGWGERCGNADLYTIVPNLQLKLGYACLPPERLPELVQVSRALNELANLAPDPRAPYVGRNAFTHKAGMHIDAVTKNPQSFEHIAPEAIGATRETLLSEVAGRTAIVAKARRFLPKLTKQSPDVQRILDELKKLEHRGYQFEGADASFELMVRRLLGLHTPFFELKGFKVVVTEPALDGNIATAMIEVVVDAQTEITAAVGNGPVNALDAAARKALERFYPQLHSVILRDYSVRVLDPTQATAATVRVLIESTDGTESWTTVGVSADVIDASWLALVDSLEYKLLRDEQKSRRDAL